jgi:hypothetical protein
MASRYRRPGHGAVARTGPRSSTTDSPSTFPSASGRAVDIVADVLAVERDPAPGVVHGDFGLHNVIWQGSTASGLIDFDHLGLGDPAIDIAPLVGKFSIAELSADFESEILRRAMIHRASLPLQVAAAAELAGNAELRDYAPGNFTHRSRSGTLYDPAGQSPPTR